MEIVIGLIIGLAVGGIVAVVFQRQAVGLRADTSGLREQLRAVESALQELQITSSSDKTQLEERDRQIGVVTAERDEARVQLESRVEELATVQSDLSARQAALEQVEAALKRDRAQLADHTEMLDRTRMQLETARTELEGIKSTDQTRQEELEKRREELDTHFKGLAAEIASASNEEFRKQAAEDFKRQRELAEQELKQQVEPVGKELEQLRKYVGELEKARAGAYEGVNRLIEETQRQVGRLNSETGDLREILRSARHRGQWGEATLENIFELAGLRQNTDFFKQTSGERGTGIADFVVRLPGGKRIIIDSKTPFDTYREALSAETLEAQAELLQQHAKTVQDTAAALAGRKYQDQFDDSLDFVIMWIPTDSILEGATRAAPALIEDTFAKHRVLLATPVTMIALVSGLAAALRQEEEQELLHENALAIQAAGQRLYDGVRRHAQVYGRLGNQLETLLRTYDDGVGSMQGNLLQGARQMRELGGGREGIAAPEPDAIRLSPRKLTSKDLVDVVEQTGD